jgi:hypothetical protein
MVYCLVRDNDHGLTIILVVLYGQKFMIAIGSNGCFVTSAPCLNGCHGYRFDNSVGHQCCITGPLGQHQSYGEWINILGISCRIEL